jgi:nicotinate-nucleotide adenylyltransferase
MSRKIGLFFGSFNPVHVGHLALANYIAENTDRDEVWFVLSPHNPFKEKKSLLADHHRLQILKEAIDDNPLLKVSDIEFKLPQPSYTITTLTYLSEKYPEFEFSLICGTDILPSFHKWKNYQLILENYSLIVYNRPGNYEHPYLEHKKFTFIQAPLLELSSSFIRQSIRDGKSVRYFLPDNVFKYIDEMNFYKK